MKVFETLKRVVVSRGRWPSLEGLNMHLHFDPADNSMNIHDHVNGHYPGDDGHDDRAIWANDLRDLTLRRGLTK